jgi:hypothetical protein
MNTIRTTITALLMCLAACASLAAGPGDNPVSDELLRSALERLYRQGNIVADSDAAIRQLNKDAVRDMYNTLPSNNPLKGAYGGSSSGLASFGSYASSGSASSALIAGSCPTNLRHLAGKMPRFNNSTLESVRAQVLDTDMLKAFQDGRSMGYSPSQIASSSVQQAAAARDSRESAKQCFRGFSVNPGLLSQVDSGTYRFNNDGSANESCITQYVLAYYQDVASQGAAVALACLARSNP